AASQSPLDHALAAASSWLSSALPAPAFSAPLFMVAASVYMSCLILPTSRAVLRTASTGRYRKRQEEDDSAGRNILSLGITSQSQIIAARSAPAPWPSGAAGG